MQNPYLISIGDRAEAIVLLFQERQLTTQEALRQLQELVQELQEAEGAREEKGLPAEAFAVYWLLGRKEIDGADEIGNAMASAFAQHPHWKVSERQAREVRRKLYKALIQAGKTEDVSQLVDHVLKIISGV